MDEGIFKTGRTGLIGSRRVDIQVLWAAKDRAKRLERASAPRKQEPAGKEKQLRLPGV